MIAIDSLSVVGASSVAREVATRLGWFYLDTGAMYRAATLALLRAYPDLDLSSKVRVPKEGGGLGKWPLHADNIASLPIFGKGSILWPGTELGLELDPENFKVFLGGEDVTEEIRSPSVEWHVRAVAGLPFVRQALLNLMRGIILETGYRIVVEGRDITTVVAPEAKIKIILEADREVRLDRLAARHRNARSRGVDLSPGAGRGGVDGEGVDIDYLLAFRDNFDAPLLQGAGAGAGGNNPAGNQKQNMGPEPNKAPNPQIRRDVRPGAGEVYTIDTTHWSVWRVANWIIKRLLDRGVDYRLENSRLVEVGGICKNTHLNHGSSRGGDWEGESLGGGVSSSLSSGHWCAVAGACCDFDNPYNQNPSDCDGEELAALQYLDETDQLEQR